MVPMILWYFNQILHFTCRKKLELCHTSLIGIGTVPVNMAVDGRRLRYHMWYTRWYLRLRVVAGHAVLRYGAVTVNTVPYEPYLRGRCRSLMYIDISGRYVNLTLTMSTAT